MGVLCVHVLLQAVIHVGMFVVSNLKMQEFVLICFVWYFFLKESECKAYNPRPFCKTYTMDKQPLNTGEQKDMTEFFTDLITKIEEMSPELVSY